MKLQSSTSNVSLITALAASITITHTSLMVTTFALELDGRNLGVTNFEHAWPTLADVVTPALCTKMQTLSSNAAATWMWFTLSALTPHGECMVDSAQASADPAAPAFTWQRGQEMAAGTEGSVH